MYRSSFGSFLNWSVRAGRLFGIPIDLNFSLLFFLLPVLSAKGVLFTVRLELAVLVVLCILAHELGHALTAKHYRLTGLSITLHGFGGFAVSHGARTPKQDLAIVLAGPAVTFAIGLVGLAVGRFFPVDDPYSSTVSMQLWIIAYLGSLNILLGFLNLIPCLPWDGGQALAALLSFKHSEFKARRAVGHLGLIIAPCILIYALIGQGQYLMLFGLMGLLVSYTTLRNTGGVRFGEVFADRRHAKQMEAVRKREAAKTEAYLDDVRTRLKEREERERLRKLLESSLDDN